MDCKGCKFKEEKTVPWAAVELLNGTHAQTVKRLWTVIVILIAALVICNAAWLYAWQQYDWVDTLETIDYTQDGRGINIIGNDNEAGQYGTEIEGEAGATNP